MTQPEAFQGTPWGAKPTERWNLPDYWDSYYRKLMQDHKSPYRLDWAIHREMYFLMRTLPRLGAVPAHEATRRRVLDAGCGLSLIPHVLAWWGLRVTAIDFSSRAIDFARSQCPTEAELARCIPIWDLITEDGTTSRQLVDDEQRSLQELRQWHVSGGSVAYLLADWHSEALSPASFDLIYCRNSLRCSTKPYWRAALTRFRELLVPGGALLVETLNAIGIEDEVVGLMSEVGLIRYEDGSGSDPNAKFVLPWWPTG